MRTHRAKSAHLPAEYIPPTFWLVPPPPFPQVDGGGLLSRKIFSNFIFLILARYLVNGFLRLNNFFIFFWIHYQLVLIILRFLFFQIIVLFLEYRILLNSIFKILVSTRINFRSIFFICFVLYSSRLDCSIPDIKLRLVFTHIKLCRFYALSLQLFISLTLLLVINKHLCLW